MVLPAPFGPKSPTISFCLISSEILLTTVRLRYDFRKPSAPSTPIFSGAIALPLPANGQSALYQRLNGLILAYGLVNTTGPDYAPLETADQTAGQQTDEEKGRAKFRSLYPGVYVSTTLEGSYQNLRRFIREIETGREFIVVSAVELAPTETERQKDQTNPNPNPPPNTTVPVKPAFGGANTKVFTPGFNPPTGFNQPQAQPKVAGKMHGETVSLHIELAAYFRRPGFVPVPAQQ